MAAEKRAASGSFSSSQLVKRQKSDYDLNNGTVAISNGTGKSGTLAKAGTGANVLQAPTMELTGHSGEVFAVRFDPSGQLMASGSMDRSIMLWKSQGQCENYGILTGHKGAVLDLDWSRDSQRVFSASSDMTIADWDLETGLRIRRHEGHEEVINSVKVGKRGQEIFFSGSDDGTIGIWDPRQKQAVEYIQTDFPICAVAVSETGSELYSGGIDNDVKVWDLRQQQVLHTLSGHTDTVTSLEVSPDSQFLLSNSHDSTVKMWDVRPFAPGDRRVKSFSGAPLGLEKNVIKASWSSKGDRVAAGSGDGTAVVWDVQTTKILYKLPGHRGAVNDVRFAPGNQMIIVSASSDRNLIIGELTN